MLPTQVRALGESDPRTGFASDQGYLSAVEALFVAKAQYYEAAQALRDRTLTKSSAEEAEMHWVLVQDLLDRTHALESLIQSRLGHTTPRPRIVRLGTVLELQNKELLGLLFIVLHHTGTHFPIPTQEYQARGMMRNMAIFSGMNSQEVLTFLSAERVHIKDNLFEVEEDPLSYEFADQTLKMSKPVLSCLLGVPLSEEDLLSLDKTSLARVLTEEEVSFPTAPTTTESPEVEDEIEEEAAEETPAVLGPFKDDLDYLDCMFEVIACRMEIYAASTDSSSTKALFRSESKKPDQLTREFQAKERQALLRAKRRLAVTLEADAFLPRVEQLGREQNLSDFEKWVVLTLIGGILSPQIRKVAAKYSGAASESVTFTVGRILSLHFTDLRDQIEHRRLFYRSGALVRHNMVRVSEQKRGALDLMDWSVEIDRRMLDYCVRLDSELDALVEGSSLYSPKVALDRVVLPNHLKQQVLDTVDNMQRLARLKAMVGFEATLDYGKGAVLLFHGTSGTGKTMLANALANHLGRRVLLATFPEPAQQAVETVQVLFREAKLQNALVFFDECEGLFESRAASGRFTVNALLAEVERYDDVVILATNRPFDLDEAMYRRITLAVEFPPPDPRLRERIWRAHIPDQVQLDASVCLDDIAAQFDLTGGFIKNAVLGALALAARRDEKNLVVKQSDLEEACQTQVRGQAQLVSFDKRVLPKRMLDSVVLPSKTRDVLLEMAQTQKAQRFLCSQWGFRQEMGYSTRLPALFYGPPGTGKSSAAEALAHQCGKPMKVLQCAEVLAPLSSSRKSSPFSGLDAAEAVVVVEGVEEVLGGGLARGSWSLATLMSQLERVKGLVILIATVPDSFDLRAHCPTEQQAHLRKLTYLVPFLPPGTALRATLWSSLIPKEVPLHPSGIDFPALARAYPNFVGDTIQRSIFRACARLHRLTDPALDTAALADAAQHEAPNRLGQRPLPMYQ